jgi:hypothetical protein
MSIYSPTDSLRDLNSDEGMFLQNYNTCASEKKSDDRRQDATTTGNLMPND